MSKKLAIGSLLSALTVVFLLGSAMLPTGRISALALSSLCVLITVCACGTRYAFLSYIVSGSIGLLLVPSKLPVFVFIAFIGYYPIVKLYIERLRSFWLEWVVKIFFFSTVCILAVFLIKTVLLSFVNLGAMPNLVFSHLPIAILAAELMFIAYDYILSLLASYYETSIAGRLNLN